MADIIKNSFAESNRHTKVIFQRGRDVTDYELNELQDNLRVSNYRALWAGVQAETQNPGANDLSWQVQENPGGDTANKVFIQGRSTSAPTCSGYIIVDGVPLYLAAPGVTVAGFTTNPGPGARVDKLWLRVEEQEIADPNAVSRLGETTRRKKLIYSWVITEDAAADPTSTNPITLPLWVDGGVRHFLMATISRPAGVANIVTSDITDTRYLLAPYVVSQITRQSDFTVQAVVGNRFETSDGLGVVPTSDTMTFVTDSTTSGTVKRFNWVYPSHGYGTAPMYFFKDTAVATGWEGLFLGDGLAFCSDTELRISDANIYNEAPGEQIFFSTGDAYGASITAWGDLQPTARALLLKLNARPYVVVGTGGDFGTIADAVTFYNDYVSPAAVVPANRTNRACHIILRGAGPHTISTTVTCAHPLIIESEDAHAGKSTDDCRCVINFDGTPGTPAILNALAGLTLRHVNCQNTELGKIVVGAAATATYLGSFVAEDCVFYSGYTPTQSLRANRLGAAVGGEHFLSIEKVTNNVNGVACYMARCLLYTNAPACGALVSLVPTSAGADNAYIFDSCAFFGGREGCIRIGTEGTEESKFGSILCNGCRFSVIGVTTDNYPLDLLSNTGVIYPDIVYQALYSHGSITGGSITIRDCVIESTNGNTADHSHMLLGWTLSGLGDAGATVFTLDKALFDNVRTDLFPKTGIVTSGTPCFFIASSSNSGAVRDVSFVNCDIDLLYTSGVESFSDAGTTFYGDVGKLAISNVSDLKVLNSRVRSGAKALQAARSSSGMSVIIDTSSMVSALGSPLDALVTNARISKSYLAGTTGALVYASSLWATDSTFYAPNSYDGAAFEALCTSSTVTGNKITGGKLGLYIERTGDVVATISSNHISTGHASATDGLYLKGTTLSYAINGNVSNDFPTWRIISTNADETLHAGGLFGNVVLAAASTIGYVYVKFNTSDSITTYHPGCQTAFPDTYTGAAVMLCNFGRLNS